MRQQVKALGLERKRLCISDSGAATPIVGLLSVATSNGGKTLLEPDALVRHRKIEVLAWALLVLQLGDRNVGLKACAFGLVGCRQNSKLLKRLLFQVRNNFSLKLTQSQKCSGLLPLFVCPKLYRAVRREQPDCGDRVTGATGNIPEPSLNIRERSGLARLCFLRCLEGRGRNY